MGCTGSKQTATSPQSKPAAGPGKAPAAASGAKAAEGPVLYYHGVSHPCRAVMLTAAAVNLKMEMKWVDLFNGETSSDWFLKINPDHSVPVLVDGDLSLWESRAIMQYIMNKYASGNSLYPSDLQQRAIVDRWLNYDAGTLAPRITAIIFSVVFKKEKPSEEQLESLGKAFDTVDNELSTHNFIAGDNLSIADFTVYANTCLLELDDFDYSKWSNIVEYKKRMEALPYAAECWKEFNTFKEQRKQQSS